MTFIRMISRRSSLPTLSPPFTREGYHYDFQFQGYHNILSRRSHINNLFSIFKVTFQLNIYIHDTGAQPTMSRIYMHILHVSSKGNKSSKIGNIFFSLSHITYNSRSTQRQPSILASNPTHFYRIINITYPNNNIVNQ